MEMSGGKDQNTLWINQKEEAGCGLRAAGLGDYYAFNHPQPWLSNGNLRPLESFRLAITTAEGF